MLRSLRLAVIGLVALSLTGVEAMAATGLPTGPPTNLHRSFVIKRTRERAAQGKPTTRHLGVFIAGGYRETVSPNRGPAPRANRLFRRR